MEIIKELLLPTLLLVAIGLGCIQWACWIFKVGRFGHESFKKRETQNSHLRYMIANFFVNIVNDFRHLLALFIVSIFAITLFISLYKTPWYDTEKIINIMQSVSSTFGGLIGAIIGFYFGEKTGKNQQEANAENIDKSSSISEQEDSFSNNDNGVVEVHIPDDKTNTTDGK